MWKYINTENGEIVQISPVQFTIMPEQSFHNLKATISKVLNYMGRYQIALCTALLLNGLIYGINHNLPAFHIYAPTFYCKVSIDKSMQRVL